MNHYRANRSAGIDACVGSPPRTLGGHHGSHPFAHDATAALEALSSLEAKVVRILQAFQDPAQPDGGDGNDITSMSGSGEQQQRQQQLDDVPVKPQRFSSLLELSCHSGGTWQFTMQVADYIVHILEGLAKEGEAATMEHRRQLREKEKREKGGGGSRTINPQMSGDDNDDVDDAAGGGGIRKGSKKLSTGMEALNRCLSFLHEDDPNFANVLQHSQVCSEFRDYALSYEPGALSAQESAMSFRSALLAAQISGDLFAAATPTANSHGHVSPAGGTNSPSLPGQISSGTFQRSNNAAGLAHLSAAANAALAANKPPPSILSQHAFILVFALLQSACRSSTAVPLQAVHRNMKECVQARAAMAYAGASTAAMNPSARSVERGSSLPMKFYVEAKASEFVGTVSTGTVESAGGAAALNNNNKNNRADAGELTTVPSYCEPMVLYVSRPSFLCNERFSVLGRFVENLSAYPGYKIARRSWLARDIITDEPRVMTLIAAFRPAVACEEVHSDVACRPASVNHTASKAPCTPYARQQQQRAGLQLSYSQLLQGQIFRDKMLHIKYFSRALACRHPNLVSTYDVVLDEAVGAVFVTSQQALHGSLLRLDIEGRCDRSRDICTPRALFYCRQLLDALVYLHDRGVVHGLAGVCCGDIMLAEDDKVLLKGFGMLDDAVQSVLDELKVIAPMMLSLTQQTGEDLSASTPAASGGVEVLQRCPRRAPHHDNFSPPVAAAFDHLDAINAYCFRSPEAIRASNLLHRYNREQQQQKQRRAGGGAVALSSSSELNMFPCTSRNVDLAETTTTTAALMKRDVWSLGMTFFAMIFGRLPHYIDDYRSSPAPISPDVVSGTAAHPTVTESIGAFLNKIAVETASTVPPLDAFFDLKKMDKSKPSGAALDALIADMGTHWARDLREVPVDFLVLLSRMLAADPRERCSAHAALHALDVIVASREFRSLAEGYSDEFRMLLPRGQRERARRQKREKETVAALLDRRIKEELEAAPYNSDDDEDDGAGEASTVAKRSNSNTNCTGEGMIPSESSDSVTTPVSSVCAMGARASTMTPQDGPSRDFPSKFASWMAHAQAGAPQPTACSFSSPASVAAAVRRSAAAMGSRTSSTPALMSRSESDAMGTSPPTGEMVRATTGHM